ncbi:hypothetical protein GGP41_004547 [Bipolaris sorokiniana]|uniref:Uncharacterized protein n=1 Tax=Cochliobolus sativus TaxID=45130 RepID=A0A8H5Z6G1_COCSA|nr:hypothetical protein GGP41_004547 [Bipolaris sorokiniana]
MDVIQPLVQLAMRLEGAGKFWLQSIQSQAIAAKFLSSIPDVSKKTRFLNRKADFTFFFSRMPSQASKAHTISMSRMLRRDMYSLSALGYPAD